MIGEQIQIKNHDTGNSITLNDHTTDPENVIALQSFPTFESDIRQQNIARSGDHGEFRLPYFYSGMSIVLEGVIVGETEQKVWDIKKEFDDVLKLSRKGQPKEYTGSEFPPMGNNTVRLSFTTPAGDDVFIDASPIKTVSYNRPLKQNFLLNFQVILRASFPYLLIEDETTNIETGSLGTFAKGVKLSTKLPLNLANEYVTGGTTITVDSPGFAIITLNGSDDGVIVNPTVINTTNGSSTKIKRSLSNSSQKFTINGVTKKMVDQDGRSVLQYSIGDFVYLDAGDNEIVYISDKVIPN